MVGIKAEIKSLTSADFNAQKAEGVYDLGIMVNNGSSKLDFTANYIRLYSSEGVNYKNMMAKPADYEETLFGARAAKTQEEKKELLKTAARLFSHDYALVVRPAISPRTASRRKACMTPASAPRLLKRGRRTVRGRNSNHS